MLENKYKAYWAGFYKSGVAPEEPSMFARYVLSNYVNPNDSIIELGCGNGRDARFFASNNISILAVDQCTPEINELIKLDKKYTKLEYRVHDFTLMPSSDRPIDLVYSRFTLHSVDAEGQAKTLQWSWQNLSKGGKLCIETRGQKNELYKKGEPVVDEEDAYIYDSHYRRFVDFEDFKSKVSEPGFKIIEAAEDTGFAPFRDTNQHFIRIIAQK